MKNLNIIKPIVPIRLNIKKPKYDTSKNLSTICKKALIKFAP